MSRLQFVEETCGAGMDDEVSTGQRRGSAPMLRDSDRTGTSNQ